MTAPAGGSPLATVPGATANGITVTTVITLVVTEIRVVCIVRDGREKGRLLRPTRAPRSRVRLCV